MAISTSPTPGTPGRYGDVLFRHDHDAEYERLTALAQTYDATTHTALPLIHPGWYCLDVGAGTGTIAHHMARCAAPHGGVYALDRDPNSVTAYPHLRAYEADITEPTLDLGTTFDLIHARFVLMHLHDWRTALDTMIRHTAPGGWIVLSDALPPPQGAFQDGDYGRVLQTLVAAVTDIIGSDLTRAEHYPDLLHQAGFRDITLRVDVPTPDPPAPFTRFLELSARQIQPHVAEGTLTDEDITGLTDYLNDPATRQIALPMATTRARRH